MIRRSLFVLASLAVAVLGAACGSPEETTGEQEGEVNTGSALFGGDTSLFGNDRVGLRLKDDLAAIPKVYPELEDVFKVGRACVREDGKKEIYIVEEASDRSGGSTAETSTLLPRAVVGGCNTGDPSDPATAKNSFSLLSALISRENRSGDTMVWDFLESMAYDERTGLFNFYTFNRQLEKDGPRVAMARFWRSGDGKVFRRVLPMGATEPKEPEIVYDGKNGDKACFGCHLNGAPLMNELSEPWTNWISPKKRLPTSKLSGSTKELVEQATLADHLEQVIRSATETYANGLHPLDGWVNRTRDGLLPGGVAEMLKPLFCQTELNYLSADTTLGLPLQLFFDPSVTAGAALMLPAVTADAKTMRPFLLPVRAVRDEVTERVLVKRDYITDGIAVAIRLLDDENDVFSSKRCGVFEDVKKELAATASTGKVEPKEVKAMLRRVIGDKAPKLGLDPAHLTYLQARLAGTVHQKKQEAYFEALRRRFEGMDKDVAKREAARKKAMDDADFPTRPRPQPEPK